jgi:dTDP-4-dehydrorhamnose reductase
MTSTGACEKDPQAAERANVLSTRNLVEAAGSLSGPLPYLVAISTDLVFDGESAPYDENAPTSPVMEYGRTKEAAEQVVQKYSGDWTILRPAILYGPAARVRGSFLEWILGPLREGSDVELFLDEWRTPVLVGDVAEAIVRLVKKRVGGILHCGGAERLSRWEMGEHVARRWGLPKRKLKAVRRSDAELACPRPKDVSLVTGRLVEALGFRPVGFSEGIERFG